MKKKIGTFSAVLICGVLAMAPDAAAQTTQTNFFRQIVPGPNIFAYFEGRSPCQEIVKLWGVPDKDECIKIKWQLVLYQDPVTHAPTTFALGGLLWRNPPRTGKWEIVKGTKENPDAVVYKLGMNDPKGFLSFQKADENILFFLNPERELMVGNENFSYTLNRAELPRLKGSSAE